MKIRKGDTVQVLAGNDKGKTGEVLEVIPSTGKIVVKGVNVRKKHIKPRKQGEEGGIIPVECQACGRPVIAFGKGGTLETVAENKTGIFFKEQTAESVKEAILKFEDLEKAGKFDSATIVNHAQNFSSQRFRNELQAVIDETLAQVAER